MFKRVLLVAVIPVVTVLAVIGPLEPAPGDVFKPGSQCTIAWSTDKTGEWTEMNIELMTGANEEMVHLTTVGTVDGTKDSSFSWTCPEVTPNSAIYFYQFSSPVAPDTKEWTGRFAISDANGDTVDPTEEADGIKFGTGALSDPSSATAPPSYLSDESGSSGNATVVSSTATSTTHASSATSSVASARTNVANPSGSDDEATSTSSGTAASSTTTSTASSAAALSLDLKTRVLQAFAGLVGTAVVFSMVL